MLSKLGREGTRLYRYTVQGWDEKPQFHIKKAIGARGAQDPAVQIYLTPAPNGGPGRETDDPNISDIYRWTDWGTKEVTIVPRARAAGLLGSIARRTAKKVKVGNREMLVYSSVSVKPLHFPDYAAKTLPKTLISGPGGSDTSRWTRTHEVTRSTRPRHFTRIIQGYLQKRITRYFVEAVEKGRARGMRGEKG
jgi:hypothetical protein